MIKIKQQRIFDYSPEEVWAVLEDFPNVYKWAPMVAASHQVSANASGDGAARSCSVPGFGDVVETVSRWDDGEGFAFDWEATGPVRGGRSTWTVRKHGSGAMVVAEIDAETRYGILGRVLGQTLLKGMMNRLMADALRGLEHYLGTGEVIDRDVAKRLGLKAA